MNTIHVHESRPPSLPRLATGETAQEIAAQALKALMVATSVERALFVGYHKETGSCEVVVHAELDNSGFQAHDAPYSGDPVFPADRGIVARVPAAQITHGR